MLKDGMLGDNIIKLLDLGCLRNLPTWKSHLTSHMIHDVSYESTHGRADEFPWHWHKSTDVGLFAHNAFRSRPALTN